MVLLIVCCLPSPQRSVAAVFAANGLVIALGRYRTEVPCFDAEFLSCHSHEKEILFFGSDSPLQIRFILKVEEGKWKKFALEIKVISTIRCLARGFEMDPRPSPDIQGKIQKVLNDVIHKNEDKCHNSAYIRDLLHHQVAIAPEHIILDWGTVDREYAFLHRLILRNRKERVFHFENLSKLFRKCQHFTMVLDEDGDLFQATVDTFGSAIADLHRIEGDMTLRFQWNFPEDESMNDTWIALHVHQKQLNTLNIISTRDHSTITLNPKYNGITYISLNEREHIEEAQPRFDSPRVALRSSIRASFEAGNRVESHAEKSRNKMKVNENSIVWRPQDDEKQHCQHSISNCKYCIIFRVQPKVLQPHCHTHRAISADLYDPQSVISADPGELQSWNHLKTEHFVHDHPWEVMELKQSFSNFGINFCSAFDCEMPTHNGTTTLKINSMYDIFKGSDFDMIRNDVFYFMMCVIWQEYETSLYVQAVARMFSLDVPDSIFDLMIQFRTSRTFTAVTESELFAQFQRTANSALHDIDEKKIAKIGPLFGVHCHYDLSNDPAERITLGKRQMQIVGEEDFQTFWTFSDCNGKILCYWKIPMD